MKIAAIAATIPAAFPLHPMRSSFPGDACPIALELANYPEFGQLQAVLTTAVGRSRE
jgi:hypothetical protein